MIDVKKAVNTAKEYIQDFFAPETLSGLELEEVELSEDAKTWLVTLGFTSKKEQNVSELLASRQAMREYKLFRIDAETGQILSMKTRTYDRYS